MKVLSINQLAAQDSRAIKTVWETLREDSCPYHYNFHLHTNCSDGQLTPIRLVDQAIAIGLKGFAITDHHCVEGYQIAHNYLLELQQKNPRELLPQLWTGIEITAKLYTIDVHILGYAFNPKHPSLENYLTGETPIHRYAQADQVIKAIQLAGGYAVLAHPCRYSISEEELIPQAAKLGIDAVEAYYAYGNPQPWFPSPKQSNKVKKLAVEYDLLMTCGTDTHGTNLLQRI